MQLKYYLSGMENLKTAEADFTKKKRQWVRCGQRLVDRRNINECLEVVDCCCDDGASVGIGEYGGNENQHWQSKYLPADEE